MKQILVKSVYDAFEYVMDHYYPYGLEEFAMRKDSYAVISIQDTHTGGFGFTFTQSLLIHCYAGQSRSLAIGRFISEIYGLPVQEGNYNQYVYALLKETYHRIHQE